jgi:hypothetical protein
MNDFYKEHYSWMTSDQWECFQMLCDIFYGAHHVYGKIQASGKSGIFINAKNASNHFATFDYCNMTRAVVMAHDRCIRFAIEPSKSGMLKLVFHKRHTREGDISERHPTLAEAIKAHQQGEQV